MYGFRSPCSGMKLLPALVLLASGIEKATTCSIIIRYDVNVETQSNLHFNTYVYQAHKLKCMRPFLNQFQFDAKPVIPQRPRCFTNVKNFITLSSKDWKNTGLIVNPEFSQYFCCENVDHIISISYIAGKCIYSSLALQDCRREL